MRLEEREREREGEREEVNVVPPANIKTVEMAKTRHPKVVAVPKVDLERVDEVSLAAFISPFGSDEHPGRA